MGNEIVMQKSFRGVVCQRSSHTLKEPGMTRRQCELCCTCLVFVLFPDLKRILWKRNCTVKSFHRVSGQKSWRIWNEPGMTWRQIELFCIPVGEGCHLINDNIIAQGAKSRA